MFSTDNLEDSLKKKKASTLSASYNPATQEIDGYKFKEDKIANIIAYCFGGDKNKLDDILKGADAIEDKAEKKKYIEDQVRDHAGNFDNSIKTSLTECFANAKQQYQDQKKSGKINPENDQMFSAMQGLGLNVNSDNFTTSYQEGPNGNPKVYTMVWVNRPTAEMADENSQQNKLAQEYGACLDGKEKTDFQADIQRHQDHAKNGGPVIDKAEFQKSADEFSTKAFQDAQETQGPAYRKEMALAQAKEIAKDLASGKKGVDFESRRIVDKDPLAQVKALSARAAPASQSTSLRESLSAPRIETPSSPRTLGNSGGAGVSR